MNNLLYENEGLVACLDSEQYIRITFKTKLHVVSQAVLDDLSHVLDIAEKNNQAIIIAQEDDCPHFSAGANLREFLLFIDKQDWHGLDRFIDYFQQVVLRLRTSRIPTIAIVKGYTLGGGLEIATYCDHRIVDHRAKIGFVESKVGLLATGGGITEMARYATVLAKQKPLYEYIETIFLTLIKGYMGSTAQEAREMGLLKSTDHIVKQTTELLPAATKCANKLLTHYKPALPKSIQVIGQEGKQKLLDLLKLLKKQTKLSEHDVKVGQAIADILCGGDVEEGSQVNWDWFLTKEREYFVALAKTALTYDRIIYTLAHGKPLKN